MRQIHGCQNIIVGKRYLPGMLTEWHITIQTRCNPTSSKSTFKTLTTSIELDLWHGKLYATSTTLELYGVLKKRNDADSGQYAFAVIWNWQYQLTSTPLTTRGPVAQQFIYL